MKCKCGHERGIHAGECQQEEGRCLFLGGCDCNHFTPSEYIVVDGDKIEKHLSGSMELSKEKGCGKDYNVGGRDLTCGEQFYGEKQLCPSCSNLFKAGRQLGRTNITTEQVLEGSNFNLSDKMEEHFNEWSSNVKYEDVVKNINNDVKEFIKKLKELDVTMGLNKESFADEIDELAGDDLI